MKRLNAATLSVPQLPLKSVTMETDSSHIPAVIGSSSYITVMRKHSQVWANRDNNNNNNNIMT